MKTCFACVTIFAIALISPSFDRQETGQDAAQEVLRAKRFELVDENGLARIEMRIEDQNPVIALKDEEGRDRVLIFQQSDATGLYIKDAAGDTRVGLAQFPHGGGLAIHGEKSRGAAVYVLMQNQARLDIYNKEGELTNRWPEKAK